MAFTLFNFMEISFFFKSRSNSFRIFQYFNKTVEMLLNKHLSWIKSQIIDMQMKTHYDKNTATSWNSGGIKSSSEFMDLKVCLKCWDLLQFPGRDFLSGETCSYLQPSCCYKQFLCLFSTDKSFCLFWVKSCKDVKTGKPSVMNPNPMKTLELMNLQHVE